MDEPQNGPIQRSLNIDARSSTIHQLVGNQHNHNDGIHYHVTNAQQFDHTTQILEKLRPADMRTFNRPRCLDGTRTSAVRFITDWAINPDTFHKILWIHGLAGIGKSTITFTIADCFDEMNRLGAFVFFDRDVAERCDPGNVITTLAYQVALSHPSLGKTIASVLEKYPKISMSPPRLQFQRLLVEPLTSMHGEDSLPILLIIDALDECGTSETRSALLKVLAESPGSLPASVRFLVTSRPERDIMHAFGESPHILKLGFDILLDNNVDDISAFIRYQLAQIKKHTYHLASKTAWPAEVEIGQLVGRASGLFVWASTALQFISGYDPRKRLEVILNGTALNGAENALDALYHTALEAAGRWDDKDFVSDFRAVIGIILSLRRPLSSTSIDLLLGSNHSSCDRIISHLGCVLQQNPTVRLLHPSFGDFLRAPHRNLRDIWSFDDPDQNIITTIHTLQHLRRKLKRNMCNMTLSDDSHGEKLSDDLTYACLFWVDHICAIDSNASVIMEDLGAFIFVHLLHWFEAMSILKRSRSAITILDDLLSWLLTHSLSLSIAELASDAIIFAKTFARTLEEHPLLVYYSALPYAPRSSAIYQVFISDISCPVITCGFQQSWPSYSLILTGHEEPVKMAVFSPDGRSIASSSMGGTVRVWDAKTGAELFSYMCHTPIRDMIFSPDGLRLLSASSDGLFRVWDALSGIELLPTMPLDIDVKFPGAFSADGMKFVFNTDLGFIYIVDLDPCAQLHQISTLYTSYLAPVSVSFSPDGGRLISGFIDGSIRVHDVASGLEMTPTMRKHSDFVCSVAFSPNGTRIVSASSDGTIRVWSVESGFEIFPALRGHRSGVTSVVFSPDGTVVVSGSLDGTIRVWDAILGVEVEGVLRQHEHPIRSVAFSPDGRSIVSTSDDGTAHVWKMSTDSATIIDVRRDRGTISAIALSPDGSKIASGSYRGTISIWDAQQGTETRPPPRKHKQQVCSIIFSPDGTRIFSCSNDRTIRAFDIITGCPVFPAIRHQHAVISIAICPLGNRIVSGDNKGATHIWDANLGVQIRIPKLPVDGHHGENVYSVAFSFDGTMFVSASYHYIKIWDASSGALLNQFKSSYQQGFFSHVVFSLDGSLVYCRSKSDNLVWSVASSDHSYSGKVTADFAAYSHLFSGLLIVVTSEGWLVHLKTMRTLYQLPAPILSGLSAINCSPDLIAIATQGGHIYVIRLPPDILRSPETRPAEMRSGQEALTHRI